MFEETAVFLDGICFGHRPSWILAKYEVCVFVRYKRAKLKTVDIPETCDGVYSEPSVSFDVKDLRQVLVNPRTGLDLTNYLKCGKKLEVEIFFVF